jgi:flagellar L-ring protein precursor FlgH
MMSKFIFTTALAFVFASAQELRADPPSQPVGSVWGHPNGTVTVSTAGPTSMLSDPLAHAVGDLLTIIVNLQNTVTKAQNTTTAKTTSVAGTIGSLVYPTDATNHGWNFINYHGQNPTTSWNSAQSFNGGGTIANSETTTDIIQARVVAVGPNGVMRVEATRLSRAGAEDSTMILTGLVRPEDLSSSNTVSSSNVADLQIIQKGKGTLTEDQRKGWLTKFYEFIDPF